jgi:hypothetical protein
MARAVDTSPSHSCAGDAMDRGRDPQVLEAAMPIRIPIIDPNRVHPRERVEPAPTTSSCAFHRAELEEALYWCIEAGKALRREWDDLQGYQVGLSSRPTKDDVDRAKRELRPDVWKGLDEARTLTESIKRQISRLGGSDYDAASRVYTMLSGS